MPGFSSGFNVGYEAFSAERLTGVGRGSKPSKSRYPRKIMIDGMLHLVFSPQQERQLLSEYRARIEADAIEAFDAKPEAVKPMKTKIMRVARRVAEVDTRESEWLQRLIDEDDEILTAIH